MKRVHDILMKELWTSVILTALIVVLFESELILPGFLSDEKHVQLFVGMIMIIIVLAFIPLSLYLFKIKAIHQRLTDDESLAPYYLLRFGTLRMMMLCVPMVVGMFLYYAFGENVRFFYLSVICALCLIMIYPTMKRCLVETGIENHDDDSDDDSDKKEETDK